MSSLYSTTVIGTYKNQFQESEKRDSPEYVLRSMLKI